MSVTNSTTCLVDHGVINSGYDVEDSEGASFMESDRDSCSSHSSATSSSSAASGDCRCSSQPHQQRHRHGQQPETQEEEEVMFYHSTKALWDSLAYITSLKEMCDVIFYVGRTRQPVYGVKSLLSVRSRVMYLKILQVQRTIRLLPKTSLKRHHSPNDVTLDDRVHIDVPDFDAKVFSQLVAFLHSGRVKVDVSTALGLYCAAREYEVRDLSTACWDFVERCVQRGRAHTLLTSGRAYLGRQSLDKLSRRFLRV